MNGNVIDSHQHFWQVGRFDYPWMSADNATLYRDFLPGDLEPILSHRGVRRTVLVQASNSLAETRWLLELADRHAFIGGVVGWVDLTSPRVEEQVAAFIAHPKFKGVRHLVESEPADDWLVQPQVIRGLNALAARGVTYDLLVHTPHLKHVLTVAERCPGLRMVVDHLAKPPIAAGEIKQWSREMRAVAQVPGIHCKLSGLVTEADPARWTTADLTPYVECALEWFGPRRMMIGSDWPVCLLAATYERALDAYQELLAGLNEYERQAVLAGTAASFYQLQDHLSTDAETLTP
ncbi:MAG TPA: amidohydrolase family protein [Blastocatellia bacterium]|nr:amidohydrolase family protein [Blastocatellia bacterium]